MSIDIVFVLRTREFKGEMNKKIDSTCTFITIFTHLKMWFVGDPASSVKNIIFLM